MSDIREPSNLEFSHLEFLSPFSNSFIMENTSDSSIKFNELSLYANVSISRFSKLSYSRYSIINVITL